MPKTRTGEIISWKEFGTRWKAGIEGITPLQQLKSQIQGTYISLLGIIFGIIASSLSWKQYWWIIIILIGAFIVTASGLVGMKQKYKDLMVMETLVKSIDEMEVI